MAMITFDCPHCFSSKMTFDVAGFRWIDQTNFGHQIISVGAFCRSCKRLVEAILVADKFSPQVIESGLNSHMDLSKMFQNAKTYPERPEPEAPSYVSPEVERAFLQAERARLRGDLDASGTMYRKALDVGTKQKAPQFKGQLNERLKKMSAANMLTPDIADWADHIRLIGNDAAHEPEEPTQKETDDLANLTRVTLVYLFEMPERIKLMRGPPSAQV